MQAWRVGEHALLVECADAADVPAAYAALLAVREHLGAVDVVPAARTVLVDGVADLDAALAQVAELPAVPDAVPNAVPNPVPNAAPSAGPVVEIPVRYDGPDLDEVARQWRLDVADVVALHQRAEFVVAFCGFAPGFAYCTGLPSHLVVSRRAEPRSRVPAGSVALAGPYTSVYPTASPGGWQLIGSTDTRVWQPDADRPALLEPGTRVRFRDVSVPGSPVHGVVDG
jgi:KipI family sensor histidine kinase inhibitor